MPDGQVAHATASIFIMSGIGLWSASDTWQRGFAGSVRSGGTNDIWHGELLRDRAMLARTLKPTFRVSDGAVDGPEFLQSL